MFSRSFTRLFLALTLSIPSLVSCAVYQAENGVLSGTSVGSTFTGFTGTGYVESFDEANDSLTFTVTSEGGGLHDLSIRYSAPYGAKYTRVSLNGEPGGEVSFDATAESVWKDAPAGQVLLVQGENTITLTSNWGWYLIDSLNVTASAPRPPHNVPNKLVNPRATAAARNLFSHLLSQYGKKMLSGQQDIQYIKWIEDNFNTTVAIAGLDLMDYSPSRVERGTVGVSVDEAIAWDKRNGVVTFTWHWNAPSGLIDVPGKEWWRGFYTDSTTFDVAAALSNTTNADYTLLIRDIDAIAVQLKKLQVANIPVLWRPLHEAEGGWFWWGAKGPEPCKKLWRILYDRLTKCHNLNNLIWVWNSIKPEWYPGADVVDIVSFDSYPGRGDHGPLSTQFNQLVSLTNDTKLIAVTEVGPIPDPELIKVYGLRWSWFVTWGGEFIQDGSWNEPEFLKKLFTNEFVLNLEDLPRNWKRCLPGRC